MRWMAAGSACVMMMSWIVGAGAAQNDNKDAGWKPLFNGKNLNGWSVHYASKTAEGAPPAASMFAVEKGVIHAYPTQPAGSEQPNAYLETDARVSGLRTQPRIPLG